MLTLWSAVVGASSLPPAAHKTLLALSSADVTAALSDGGTGDMLPPLLEPLGAVGRGAACALAAALLLPRGRVARTSARRAHCARAAAGVGAARRRRSRAAERGAAAEQRGISQADRRAAAVAHAVDASCPPCDARRRRDERSRFAARAARWDDARRATPRSLLDVGVRRTRRCARARATAATRRWRSRSSARLRAGAST